MDLRGDLIIDGTQTCVTTYCRQPIVDLNKSKVTSRQSRTHARNTKESAHVPCSFELSHVTFPEEQILRLVQLET